MNSTRSKWTWIATALFAVLMIPSQAFAFCGFYVGGAGADMFADATQVVLMRDGTTTVLSMQNRYSGPLDDFALVVPVPQVLMEENVKTLPQELFGKVDTLTSPRLVEYWEKDPCQPEAFPEQFDASAGGGNNGAPTGGGGVTVEAQFEVGEYNVAILSATESTALDTYLQDNNYNVPAGAAPYYQPYIDGGMYFFVAKVDSTKVSFDAAGNAVLSPLRFAYESDEFSLPVRLGMINSNGQQDLIVYTLAKNQRYELANYPNAFIPTNIEVVDDVRNDFPSFYRALFARTLKENPGAAVTEYSWNAGTCDPCPGPVNLGPEDIATLGGDVIDGIDGEQGFGWGSGYVVTRMHMRYDKDEVGEDLVFRTADPVVGGREVDEDDDGEIDQGAFPSSVNNFQGRYIIRHAWDGSISCADPVYGRWGGPEGADRPTTTANPSPNTTGGQVFDTAGSNEVTVEERVREDVPEINVKADVSKGEVGGGCSSTDLAGGASGAGLALLSLLGLAFVRRRRR